MGYIKVKNVSKAYKRYCNNWHRLLDLFLPSRLQTHEKRWALNSISFVIHPGEAVGIIGNNGAGKSTLLKIITGTTAPTTGSVGVGGKIAALLELGMGFHQDFTGYDNVFMAGQLLGLTNNEIRSKMSDIENFAEIGDYINQPLRTYSSGMQVRLAFSVATAVRPDILIVDEALAVGDIFFQQKCFERIKAFKEQGTTLLFVSHSLGTVYSLCDRALLLENGNLLLDATPKAVIDLYQALELKRNSNNPASTQVIKVNDPLEFPAQRSKENIVKPMQGNDKILTAPSSPTLNESMSRPVQAVGSFYTDGASIVNVQLLKDGLPIESFVSESVVTIAITSEFSRTLDDPHVGFQIRDTRGEPIFMTNTYCMRQKIGPVAQGTKLLVQFTFKASFAPGQYTITAGLANGGILEAQFREVLSRVQNAIAVTVLRNVNSILWSGHYNVDPRLEIQRF